MAASSSSDVPPIPSDLRRRPQERSVGPGKRYADRDEFLADLAAWEQEPATLQMKARQKALEKRRDRSGRQRDGATETDGERRVRQRQEKEGAQQGHAECEAARRKARRKAKQEAWARDIAAFAAVFDGWVPVWRGAAISFAEANRIGLYPQHPLAYRGFRRGWWLKDGAQIVELHAFIERTPPTGDEEWEEAVDKCALRVWRAPSTPGFQPDSGWHPSSHPGDGYCMLLSLPSALPSMRSSWEVHEVLKARNDLISGGDNEMLAERGFEPLAGWEPFVQAGYMPRPAYLELSAAEIRRRRARFYFEQEFAFRQAQIFPTGFVAGFSKTLPGDRSHHAWAALKAHEICTQITSPGHYMRQRPHERLPGCQFQICRCPIGIVLDANMDPVEPKRAARLDDC